MRGLFPKTGATRVSNTYDSAWRVIQKTLADGSTVKLAYTTDINNKITQAEVTDRRGTVRRAEFDATQQLVKNTFALGKPEQYIETYEYTNGHKTAMVDALGRRTQCKRSANPS